MEITELMIKDNYDPNEEFYAYETKDKEYIEFLKRTGQYKKIFKKNRSSKKWKQQNKKEQSENSKQK